ncbi:MAG: hypothetical protein ACRCSF_07815 [Mycobacteriaceae bacterium]
MGVIIKAVGTSYNESSSSVIVHAGKAIRSALSSATIQPEEVGVLINTCVYRDSNMIEPAIAALIQKDAGIGLEYEEQDKTTISFDLMNGACGVLNAVQVATSLLQTASTEHVVIVAGDTHPSSSISGATEGFPYSSTSAALVLALDSTASGFGPIHSTLADGPSAVEGFLDMSSMGANGRNLITIKCKNNYEAVLLDTATTVANAALSEIEDDLSSVLLIASTPTATFPSELGKKLGIQSTKNLNLNGTEEIFHTAALPLGYFHAEADNLFKEYSSILFVAAGAGPSAAATLYRVPTATGSR